MPNKKRFSAAEWENVPSEQATTESQQDKTANGMQGDKPLPDIFPLARSVVEEIESQHIDIAPSYEDWVKVGFALADGLEEQGRDLFHRLSRQYAGYDADKTDKQYTNCLNGKKSGVTISTFFYRAGLFGVKTGKDQKTKRPKDQNGNLVFWENPEIPDGVFQNLPGLLKEIVDNAISKEDRDVVLLGALGCVSACLDNVCGVYDERVVYPNLYLFVVADAGMGKGALNLCLELVSPINGEKKKNYRELLLEYRRRLAEYKREKKRNPEAVEPTPPPQLLFVIPANSSASSFLSILADNDGVGLLFESEGDTLSQTLKSEHGNYSDLLRKGFHHERISLSRRKDKELIEVETPQLSVVLSGTPDQVRRLIPTTEDGLFSRFMFYMVPFHRNIRNVFSTNDINQSKHMAFKSLGERFLLVYRKIKGYHQISVRLSVSQQERFVTWLTMLNNRYCNEIDDGMQGVVRRLGLIAFRMMMTFTILRNVDSLESSEEESPGTICLECAQLDYDTSLLICECLIRHSSSLYVKLSPRISNDNDNTGKGATARRYALFNMLPEEFTKPEFDAIVQKANENLYTAKKWIEQFINDGVLTRIGHGRYRKLTE